MKSVCIIDDDSIFLYIAKRLMKESHFCEKIMVFNNGQHGMNGLLDLYETEKEIPSIIFLDLSMPIMSGWEFLESLPNTPISKVENLKIIVMSSSINPNEIEQIKAYPMVTDYIVKPINPSDLKKIAAL